MVRDVLNMLSTNPASFSTMQPSQQFVESLVALKNHYQSVYEKIERSSAHAQNQLTHVNALLVDQVVSDQRFVGSLIELRKQYQGMAQECMSQSAHAREQLTHVNALLADQLVQQHHQLISMSAATFYENKNHSLRETADVDRGKSLIEANKPEGESPDAITQRSQQSAVENRRPLHKSAQRSQQSGNAQTPELEESDEADSSTDEVDNSSPLLGIASPREPNDKLDEPSDPDSLVPLVASEPESIQGASANSQAMGRSKTLTPMLPQYQHMAKFQAVESVLRGNAGTILHIDYMIRLLHGELTEDAMQSEKWRMAKTLSEGALKGLWAKVPGEVGCYTIDLKLIEPDLAPETDQLSAVSKPPKAQSKRDLPPQMLPAYTELKSIDAVDLVINEKAYNESM